MAQVEIIKFASCYKEGFRGAVLGQAPQNDKVWGIAKIDNKLVNFWGRRNGKLKFKTRFLRELPIVEAKYEEKIGGRKDGGDIYTAIAPDSIMIKSLCPNLITDITKHFYSDMSLGKLNTRH